MRHVFDWMVWVLVFITPVLGMGLLSQEWTTGTIETLMTAPVNDAEVVARQVAGGDGVPGRAGRAERAVFVLMLRLYGKPDYGPDLQRLPRHRPASAALFTARDAVLLQPDPQPGGGRRRRRRRCWSLVTIVPFELAGRAEHAGADPAEAVTEQAVYHRYADFSKGDRRPAATCVLIFCRRYGRVPVPDHQGDGKPAGGSEPSSPVRPSRRLRHSQDPALTPPAGTSP